MKKKFLILFLTLILGLKVCANVSLQWSQFCPAKYANAEYLDYRQMTISKKVLYSVKSIFGFYNIDDNNYWVERRLVFEKEINACNQIEKDQGKNACYWLVRKLEFEKSMNVAVIHNLQLKLQCLQAGHEHPNY